MTFDYISNRIEIKKKNRTDFDSIFSFLYFSISHISHLLEMVGIPRVATYLVYIVFLIIFVFKTFQKIKLFDMAFYLFLIPILLIGTIKYGKYDTPIAQYAAYLLFLPAYYVFRVLEPNKIKKGLIAYSYFASIFLAFYYLLYVRGTTGYHMDFSYWLAEPVCILFYVFLKNKKIIPLAISIVGLILIVTTGSRGALLFTLLSIVVIFVFLNKSTKKIIIKLIIIGGIILAFYIFSQIIYSLLEQLFSGSRTIMKIVSGSLFSSESRQEIYDYCEELIYLNPLGYGVFASRMLIPSQPYPHSLFYELQLDYGQILGIVFFLLIILISLLSLFKSVNTDYFLPVVLFSVIGLGSLMVSSSYLQEATITSLLAIFINLFFIKNKTQQTNNSFTLLGI